VFPDSPKGEDFAFDSREAAESHLRIATIHAKSDGVYSVRIVPDGAAVTA
jgi:hypothetical protein